MIFQTLRDRQLPPLKSREEMLEILLREEYGYLPPKPSQITFEVTENFIRHFCAGKAKACKIVAKCVLDGKEFCFPFYSAIPTKVGKHPFFIHINFRDAVPDRYMPTEELIDNGFAALSFCYNDVTSDNSDFADGLAGVLFPDGKRKGSDVGKIGMWAWAAQRVMDYAETLGEVLDLSCAIVCGHSRLGKTALLAAATDERFAFAYSNDSGCSGAAITRGKQGEDVRKIYTRFPYWFCPNYEAYMDNEEQMPFDQHYLIASIAPRFACVGSASEDLWADPESEMLACLAASPAFEANGNKGFVCGDSFARVGEAYFEGSIGYHLREGLHYFGRADWHRLMEFVKAHRPF